MDGNGSVSNFYFQEGTTIFKELLINEQINVNEVRVISQEGQQLGIMKISEAHELADKANLDRKSTRLNSSHTS